MTPVLYESTEREFTSNGLGMLVDCTDCTVTEERNGGFELEMSYPVSGRSFADLTERRIIFAKPSPGRGPQPFRIYRITKNSKNTVKVYAQHISYDLSGVPVSAFEAQTASEAMEKLNTSALVPHPFTFSTDKTTQGSMKSPTPAGIRPVMGGQEGSILDTYHGEWIYDMFSVSLKEARGSDNGVLIAYGKNITTLEQDHNISSVYTAVLPFWHSDEQGLVQGDMQHCPGTYDYIRVLVQDFTDKFQDPPTVEELNAVAVKYIQINEVGVPKVSLKVSFVDLARENRQGAVSVLENIELCDTVHVLFEKLNISTVSKVVKTEYDVILDRYKSVEIGDAKDKISDTIAAQKRAIRESVKASEVTRAAGIAQKKAIDAAEEGIRKAEGRLAADIGDVAAGLHVIASANDIENLKQAETTLYAAIANELNDRVKKAELQLSAIQVGDTVKTLAKILADQITMEGMVAVTSGSVSIDGNLHILKNYSIDALNGTIVANTIAAYNHLNLGDYEYVPQKITSREHGEITVLGTQGVR